MTTFNINYISPPTLSNLIVYNTIGGANLEWDVADLTTGLWSTEIWFSSTNNRASATKVSEVKDTNTYFWQDNVGSTGYFWIRPRGIYGQTNGVWEPSSSTAGVALNVDPTSLAPSVYSGVAWRNGYSDSGSGSGNGSHAYMIGTGSAGVGTGSGTGAAAHEPGTGYGTYYTVAGSGTLNVGTTTSGVNYSVSLEIDWTQPSITTGTADIYVRVRVRDTTSSTDLKTQEFKLVSWTGASATLLRGQSSFYWDDKYIASITASHNIEIIVDMKKVRSDSATTFSIYWNKCFIWQDRES
jgi:hypothetical protein